MRDINDYADWTNTTAVYPKRAEGNYLTSGLVGEVGELFSVFAKYHRGDRGQEETLDLIKKELGDIVWFWARLCQYYGWEPSEVIKTNIVKLESRKERGTIKGDGDNR